MIEISEFGLKIKNYEAASIYEYGYGFRNNLDATNAMFTNSLFKDFLMENGLHVHKEESTRDIVCVEFGYGTKDFKTAYKKIEDAINAHEDATTRQRLSVIKANLEKNKDKCVKISKADLRRRFYNDGFDITYKTYNKKGEVIKEETIHYKMLYRTPGKAKKGTCMFINAELYNVARDFLYMGIQLPEENAPIVEIGAYSSLITSGIVGRVQIKPEEILIVKDVNTFITTDVIRINTDENRQCYAEKAENYKLKNEIFDGQALIDSSIFPSWADGYVLLRHHFSKAAAFKTHIQKFMKDRFGDEYETATVKDMWGRDVRVKDIKLITTNNMCKWIKFNVSFDYWADWVRKNDCMFGIVKTAHPSKLGNYQRMSYQMNNSLDINTMAEVVKPSVEYIEKLKSDDLFFLEYLKKNVNFSNDYEVLIALVEHNPDFIYSTYFRERKNAIIKSYVLNFKSGHSLQEGDNLTIVGSPYAMLLHAVGDNYANDPTFEKENDCIQCWTGRFNDGEYLAEFRSPFNSRNNLGYLHNTYHPLFDEYFDFGKLIIAVNLIETSFQDRNNGSDQDSDSIYTTNKKEIVEHAKYCYKNYPTIVNEIKPDANIYNLSMDNYAKIDNKLTACQMAIGQSSNLAQIALTYTYNFEDQKYSDYVCMLAVLAQIAIDNAKRTFDVDLEDEISRISDDLDITNNGLPKFWLVTKKDKRKARTDEQRKERQKLNKNKIKKQVNEQLVCPMNYIYDLDFTQYRNCQEALPMSEFFIKHEMVEQHRICKQVESLIEKYSLEILNYNMADEDDDNDYLLLRNDFDELISDIRKICLSKKYTCIMSWLINRAFSIGAGIKRNQGTVDSTIKKNKSLLMKVLYTVNPEAFLQCFKKKSEDLI